MTSSIAPSSRPLSLAVTLVTPLLVWVLVNVASESFARWIEFRFDAHLWRYEEWMQLLSPAHYSSDGHRRILVIGPSEAREAFWPEPFRETLDGARLVNDSLSLSTFEDSITQLEYIEKVYGRGAIGEVLLVAVTPRLLQNYAPGERPLPIVLNRYSPRFALDESVEPQALVEKGPFASLLARIRTAGHAGVRYQRAIRGALLVARARIRGGNLGESFLAAGLVGSRFYSEKPFDKSQYYEWTRTGTGVLRSFDYFFKLRSMDPLAQRTAILRDFGRLREIAARNGSRIIVVNLPEGGWARGSFYNPGIHEAYDSVLHEAVRDLPFVDLREALPDEGFYDWLHPTKAASVELSRRVADEIRKMETR